MISTKIRQLLTDRGYSPRTETKEQVRKNLDGLGINSDSELGSFYLNYDPSLLHSNTSYEQLQDVIAPAIGDAPPIDIEPWKSPVGMATRFVREVWIIPNDIICLTTTEGEGAYLCSMNSGVVFDFSLADQNELASGKLKPRWQSFFEFLQWYLR